MKRRWLGALVTTVAVAACGLDFVGVGGDGGITLTQEGGELTTDGGGSKDTGITTPTDGATDGGTNAEAGCGACPGKCKGATCVITCPGPGCPVDAAVSCPPGIAQCEIDCLTDKACKNPGCGDAASCAINCDGTDGCGGGATCDKSGSCTINCLNPGGCGGPVICQGAHPGYSCSLNCTGTTTCGAYAYCCAKNSCAITGPFQQKGITSCDP